MSNFSLASITATPQYRLARQNFMYALALILFLFLGVSFIPQQLLTYSELKQQEQTISEDLKVQESRLHLIESINVNDLNQLLVLLNTLYPQKEDQFSIYPVINNLEKLTGMLFVKKSSPFEAAAQGQTSINIIAIASDEQVRALLKDYPYKSARLLSLDGIIMRPTKANPALWDVDFAVIFHAGDAGAGKEVITRLNPDAVAFAREVQQYFATKGDKYTNVSVKEDDIPLDYKVKQNPFND